MRAQHLGRIAEGGGQTTVNMWNMSRFHMLTVV